MKRMLSVLLVLVLMLASVAAQAADFTSDRMAFGDIDFGGATVTVVAHFDNLGRFKEGGVEAGKLEEAKKLFNIGDIVLLQPGWGDMGQVCLNRYMAGESTWDIWRLPHAFFFDLATKGAFFDVSQVVPESYFDTLPNITRDKNEMLALEGKRFHYSVGVPDDYGHSQFLVFNKDIFEREGLPDPYELYANGEWTWDVAEEIAKRATRDTDGDGVIDQWGFHWIDPLYMILSNGGTITKFDENGRMIFSMGEEATIEALRRLNQWQNIDGITQGDYQFLEFEQGRCAMAWMPFYEIYQNSAYEFDFGVLPFPHGPNIDHNVYPPGCADAFFIPANAENALALIALDNFLWPIETYYEELDNAIRSKVKDMESYQTFQEAIEKWDGNLAYYFNFLGAWYQADTPYGGVISGVMSGKSPAAVIAEWAPMAQAKIDEVFKQ